MLIFKYIIVYLISRFTFLKIDQLTLKYFDIKIFGHPEFHWIEFVVIALTFLPHYLIKEKLIYYKYKIL